MRAHPLHGSGPFYLGLILSLFAGCAAPEEEGPADGDPAIRSLDVPYGEPALVVIVNPALAGSTTRSVPAPGSSVADVFVKPNGGEGRYTDSTGVAILSGVSGYTTLTLESGQESGQVSIQVEEGGLT